MWLPCLSYRVTSLRLPTRMLLGQATSRLQLASMVARHTTGVVTHHHSPGMVPQPMHVVKMCSGGACPRQEILSAENPFNRKSSQHDNVLATWNNCSEASTSQRVGSRPDLDSIAGRESLE